MVTIMNMGAAFVNVFTVLDVTLCYVTFRYVNFPYVRKAYKMHVSVLKRGRRRTERPKNPLDVRAERRKVLIA